MAEERSYISREKTGVAMLSVLVSSSLVVLKLIAGVISGSVSIISEAIHSGMDLVAALIAYFSVRTSDKPADKDHPFGHGKYENLSGAAEALLIFAAAIWIIYEAIKKILHPEHLDMLGWGVLVMFISVVGNTLVGRMLLKVGKKTDSLALRADAWHLLTDVYTSLGVMFALGVIWVGERYVPYIDLHWVDPAAALVVAILIIRTAWELTAESIRDLLDSKLTDEEEEWIDSYVRSFAPIVRGYHGLRTRKAGGRKFVDFHLILGAEMSVADSHKISEEMDTEISKHLSGSDVTIHVEPCDGVCDPVCARGCLTKSETWKR